MTTNELQQIINHGESETIEFKSKFNYDVIETLVAFANTSGGRVLIGVNNKKEIVGVNTNEESVQNWINEIKSKTVPSIIPSTQVLKLKSKNIVVLRIGQFPIQPVSLKGRCYKRVLNSNHLMDISEISNLHFQSLQTSWDAYPYHGATIEDINLESVSKFINRVNNEGRFHLDTNPVNTLKKLSLIKDNVPTNAAMLLFAKQELHYYVHIGRFKTPSMIIDDKIISGNLFKVVDETMRLIMSTIKVAFEITGVQTQRKEIFEYPLPALRELVLNAIVHRDYTSPTDIQIKIFDKRITIYNPGKLFGGLSVEDLKTDNYQSATRNKLIAEAFYLTRDIEKYGSGYIRIRSEILDYPTMTFDYKEKGNGFFVELKYKIQKSASDEPVNEPVNDTVNDTEHDTVNETVNDRQKEIIKLIMRNKNITINMLTERFNVARLTIIRDLNKLKEKNIIKRIGPDKGGHWEVIK